MEYAMKLCLEGVISWRLESSSRWFFSESQAPAAEIEQAMLERTDLAVQMLGGS